MKSLRERGWRKEDFYRLGGYALSTLHSTPSTGPSGEVKIWRPGAPGRGLISSPLPTPPGSQERQEEVRKGSQDFGPSLSELVRPPVPPSQHFPLSVERPTERPCTLHPTSLRPCTHPLLR